MGLTVGVDVGGTKIAAGVVDGNGSILRSFRRQSPATDADQIERTIAEVVGELSLDHPVEAVGVGAAGFVDSQRSTVLFAPNLAWRHEPLRADLERLLDLPVVVENDANAAAWGEFAFGAGCRAGDLLMVAVGTGIGGGVVLDGELYRGAAGIAGEIGHITVVPDGRPCGCGNRGCWEQYASGTALVTDTRASAHADPIAAAELIERANGDVDAITGPMITTAAAEGNPFALEQVHVLARWLGDGMATLAAVLDPATIVVGGGVAEAGELLVGPIRDRFRNQLTGRAQRPPIEVRAAELGNTAGLVGAADLARRPVS